MTDEQLLEIKEELKEIRHELHIIARAYCQKNDIDYYDM